MQEVRIPVPPHQSFEPKHPHTPPPGRNDKGPSPLKKGAMWGWCTPKAEHPEWREKKETVFAYILRVEVRSGVGAVSRRQTLRVDVEAVEALGQSVNLFLKKGLMSSHLFFF